MRSAFLFFIGCSAAALTAPSVSAGTIDGPIFMTSGQIIDGQRIVSNNGSCVEIPQNVSHVIIRNSEIGPCRNADGSYAAGVFGREYTTQITVLHNVIHDVSRGAVFYHAEHPISFENNYVYGIYGPRIYGQMVQFGGVTTGTAGSRVMCNVSDALGMPDGVGDHISMYLSLGLPNDRTEIAYNRVRGGTDRSGSAVQAGDGGGGNVWVHDNTFVNAGGGAAGISGGQNITIERNRIYSDGASSQSGVGIYVKNVYPDQPCGNNTIANNQVFTINNGYYDPPIIENFGKDDSCDAGLVVQDNSFSFADSSTWYVDPQIPGLDAAMFEQPYPQCDVAAIDVIFANGFETATD